jgi:N-acylglucosamine-6-phosphate 2-epimerase
MLLNPSSAQSVQTEFVEKRSALLAQLRGGLIVSCQAEAGEPLYGSSHMAAMSVAAAQGGAVGIRANYPQDIAAIRKAVKLPIIGIYKIDIPGFAVRVTPTLESAIAVARAGADIIALDCTSRPHPDGLSMDEHIRLIHTETHCPVMADVSNYEEGLAAQAAGADLVATTLSGYTSASPVPEAPDFELLHRLASDLSVQVIAEGRIATPEQAIKAIKLGAFAVVVGSAITRPAWITARFVRELINR